MSIYATLWKLKFPVDLHDPVNRKWVEVTAQAVPAHVGTPTAGFGYENGDPFSGFLPTPVEVDADGDAPHYRAVVLVTPQTLKGTPENGQEYVEPLLILDGETYSALTFELLYEKVISALDAPPATK